MRIALDVTRSHRSPQIYDYPLIQLRGSVQCYNDRVPRPTCIKVVECGRRNSTATTSASMWPIVDDRFRILVHLSLVDDDDQRFKLWIEDDTTGQMIDSITISLRYKSPLNHNHIVRLVYIVCRDSRDPLITFDDGRFEAPTENEDDSPESASRRISLAALMSQCFFAATIGSTFRLEFDDDDGSRHHRFPIVHRLLIARSQKELWSLTPEQLWNTVALELSNSDLIGHSGADDAKRSTCNVKFLAFLAFSRYQPRADQPKWLPSQQVRGYVSLGGGTLAVLSTHCLYTWPESVHDISHRLIDYRPIDQTRFMDDSDNRNTRAGCYCTTLGASMHELAHTFDLGHADSGMMQRQFNYIEHFFIASRSEPVRWWTDSEVAILRNHRWFHRRTTTTTDDASDRKPFEIIRNDNCLSIRSENGLVVVEHRQRDTELVIHSEVFDYSSEAIRYQYELPGSSLGIDCECFLMDREGNIFRV